MIDFAESWRPLTPLCDVMLLRTALYSNSFITEYNLTQVKGVENLNAA